MNKFFLLVVALFPFLATAQSVTFVDINSTTNQNHCIEVSFTVNNESGILGYLVQRRIAATFPWEAAGQILSTNSGSRDYSVVSLSQPGSNDYRVVAVAPNGTVFISGFTTSYTEFNCREEAPF